MVTTHLPPDFKEFLRCLNDHDVEYLLIGGYAVGYHGYPRATMDIDKTIKTLYHLILYTVYRILHPVFCITIAE